MGVIADLMVKVGADIGSFKTGMAEVQAESAKSGEAASKFGGLTMGAGLLAAGAITGVVAFGLAAVEHSTEAGQAAFQMGEQFGLAGEQASGWLTVASHLGVDHEKLSQGMKNLAKNIETLNLKGGAADAKALDAAHKGLDAAVTADAKAHQHLDDVHASLKGKIHLTLGEQIQLRDATAAATLEDTKLAEAHQKLTDAMAGVSLGNVAMQQAFTQVGVEIKDKEGKLRDMNSVLLDAADKFAAMPDGMEKTGLAMKIFGKSGQEMLPILNLGRKGLEDMTAAGKAQGDVMTNSQVKAAHETFLEHQKLDAAMSGLTKTVGTQLMPAELAIAQVLTDDVVPGVMLFVNWLAHTEEHVQALQPWFPLIAAGLTILGGVMASILIPMFIAWTVATWAQVVALGAQAIALIAATWPLLLIIIAIAAVVAIVILLVQHWDLVKRSTLSVWGAILDFFKWVWAGLVAGFNSAKASVTGAWQGMLDWFGQLGSRIASAVSGFGGLLVGTGQALIRGLVNGVTSAPGVIMNAIRSLLPGGSGGALAIALHAAGIPGFALGGIVPGPPGSPQLILAHGDEEVLTADERRRRGGGGGGGNGGPAPMYVVVQVDGRQLALAMAPHLVSEARLRTGLKQ